MRMHISRDGKRYFLLHLNDFGMVYILVNLEFALNPRAG